MCKYETASNKMSVWTNWSASFMHNGSDVDVSKMIWLTIREVFLFASYYFRMYGSQQFYIPRAIGMYELTCLYARLYVSLSGFSALFYIEYKTIDFHKLMVYLTWLVVIQGYRTTLG